MYWWIRVSPQFWMTRIPYLKKQLLVKSFLLVYGLWISQWWMLIRPQKSMKEMGRESRIFLKGEPENAMQCNAMQFIFHAE